MTHSVNGYDIGPGVYLAEANLNGAALAGATLTGATLIDADLNCADLRGADLRHANLRGANLYQADLTGANLDQADLTGANLRYATLINANLINANLINATLINATLINATMTQATLIDANLTGSVLSRAYLRYADLTDATLPHFQIPQAGALKVWKSVGNGKYLVQLEIPDGARRTASLIGRKCRAEYAITTMICDREGRPVDRTLVESGRGAVYAIGEATYPDGYDPNPAVECTHGIHFYLTFEEAQEGGF